jgi:hypothetical protein
LGVTTKQRSISTEKLSIDALTLTGTVSEVRWCSLRSERGQQIARRTCDTS